MKLEDCCIWLGAYYYGNRAAAHRGDWWDSKDCYMYRCYDHDKKMTKTIDELCKGCPHYQPYKKFYKSKKGAKK